MVHDVSFNRLPDDLDFALSYEQVERELGDLYKQMHPEQRSPINQNSDGSCVIS